MLVGKSASQGIAVGKALVLGHQHLKIEEGSASSVDHEVDRFKEALNDSKIEIARLRDTVLVNLGSDKAQIFEAHLMMIEDPELTDGIESMIRTDKVKATKAVKAVADQFISMFQAMDNEYMRERALDVQDVTQRIHRNLLGMPSVDLATLSEECILIANDITPSQMATINKKVIGIITEIGGKTSHTAIMARTLELPAVVGLKNAATTIRSGELIVLNGDDGEVLINPSEDILSNYKKRKDQLDQSKIELRGMVGLPTTTTDGRTVKLEANIASALDVEMVLKNDAEGVGLFRTEFIYMDRTSAPSEEEQFHIYKTVLEKMGGKPTVIRTLDVGGDKHLPYLNIPKEENPFLGFRAVRFCLKNPQVFKPQLRALLRASVFGNLYVMFPMISNLQEVLAAKAMMEECRGELTKEGKSFSSSIKVGIMIEIPAAAVISDVLAKHVDFFSIGTNDLIQYVCAVDRMNENVHDLYDTFHPGVLRLIQQVISAGEKAGIEVAMCGEMASNSLLSEVLLGMGLTHFSMAPSSILKTRKIIRATSFEKARQKARTVLELSSGQDIQDFLKK